ncbi:type II secretion system protein GspG [Haliangium sp.]|uniref:type II secretion system protein GspG n=1 Tax=Haliangium sp. TaxID=2663208 RepID=UPI003D0C268E
MTAYEYILTLYRRCRCEGRLELDDQIIDDQIVADQIHADARATRAGERGMTLIEILIVLAILALVMGLVIGPRVYEMFAEGQSKVAAAEVQSLRTQAFIRWQMKNPGKQCPDSLNELATLLDKKEAKDPWGNEYIMLCGDQAPPGSKGFAVMSKGPDNKQGTEDDIKSWEE